MVIKVRLQIDVVPNFFASFPEKEFFRFLKQDLRIGNCSKSYTILIDNFDLEGKLVNLVRHYARFITDFWPKKELFMWDLDDLNDSHDNFHWCYLAALQENYFQ